jgi:hypothetical protein
VNIIKICLPIFIFAFILPNYAKADGDHISLGAGYYSVLDSDDDPTADFRLEYRWGEPLFWQISPFAALEVTGDASVWGGVGLYSDFFITDHTYITPSFGAGLYTKGSSDHDLDYPLEFRSQIELGYQFENYHRVSVGFGHISNASLGDKNPGTEILNLYYHFPW